MPCERDVIFLYDGTFDGFLCCVYESVYGRCLPADIQAESQAQPSLFSFCTVPTDPARAARVAGSFPQKIGPGAAELVRDVFCSCLPGRELALLRFLLYAYGHPGALARQGHRWVAPLLAAQRALHEEAHKLLGFIRFTDTGGGLAAQISPKNFVLPYLASHFIGRLGGEDFLIFDRTHRASLVWQGRQAAILPLDGLALPPPTERELEFRALWKQFVRTIAIEARRNPRCQRSMMPKRYWPHMTEWQASEPSAASPQAPAAPAPGSAPALPGGCRRATMGQANPEKEEEGVPDGSSTDRNFGCGGSRPGRLAVAGCPPAHGGPAPAAGAQLRPGTGGQRPPCADRCLVAADGGGRCPRRGGG